MMINDKKARTVFRLCVALAVLWEAVAMYILTSKNHWLWCDRLVASICVSGFVGMITWSIGVIAGVIAKFLRYEWEKIGRIIGAMFVIISVEVIPVLLECLKLIWN